MTTCIVPQPVDRRTFSKSILAGIAGFRITSSAIAQQKNSFSLGSDQSPIRNQGERGTCYVYAVVAALEAAYKRAGYPDLDLSEEFCNDAIRMLWLEPRRVGFIEASRRENFFAMEGGGLSNGVVQMMTSCGFAVPRERAMPYRSILPFGYKHDQEASRDSRWQSQFNVGSFNLDPQRFNTVALSMNEYFGAETFESNVANDPERFEEVLQAGREVIWSFFYPGDRYSGHDERVWDYRGSTSEPDVGGHAMTIYGYNRAAAGKPYFLVKNSWGKKDTLVSYEYVRRFGKGLATSIVRVAEPRAWPELAVLGRWLLQVDGRSGIFDLYHLPGMSQTTFEAHNRIDSKTGQVEEDRRLGTFFVDGDPKNAYRVNGFVGVDGLRLNVDWNNRACAYSHRGGTRFSLRFVGGSLEVMKGKMTAGEKTDWPVVATRLRHPKHFRFV